MYCTVKASKRSSSLLYPYRSLAAFIDRYITREIYSNEPQNRKMMISYKIFKQRDASLLKAFLHNIKVRGEIVVYKKYRQTFGI